MTQPDMPPTRRLPRPQPPQLPSGWVETEEGHRYRDGDFQAIAFANSLDSREYLAERLRDAELRAELCRYLLALKVYQSREARDGAAPAPQPVAEGESVDTGDASRAGEPLTSEVAP